MSQSHISSHATQVSLMQSLLGQGWAQLPPALQAHYRYGRSIDRGQMAVEFPRFMAPVLWLLRRLGALVHRAHPQVHTLVEKHLLRETQDWRRTLTYPDGRRIHFNSRWVRGGEDSLIEFVNPWLGLHMRVWVEEGRMRYRGLRFVLKLGRHLITLPESLLGHTEIVEWGVDARHFAMDFRLTHPLLGQVFRYGGAFEVEVEAQVGAQDFSPRPAAAP